MKKMIEETFTEKEVVEAKQKIQVLGIGPRMAAYITFLIAASLYAQGCGGDDKVDDKTTPVTILSGPLENVPVGTPATFDVAINYTPTGNLFLDTNNNQVYDFEIDPLFVENAGAYSTTFTFGDSIDKMFRAIEEGSTNESSDFSLGAYKADYNDFLDDVETKLNEYGCSGYSRTAQGSGIPFTLVTTISGSPAVADLNAIMEFQYNSERCFVVYGSQLNSHQESVRSAALTNGDSYRVIAVESNFSKGDIDDIADMILNSTTYD